ncbi:hypothetical protein [Ethanoligenens harbinense]|uniref:Uncharacterized protein n=1 Tax=Ethanoligenens harbinense (strain DSM 18485 / JCM 12961 / CGMCC 1.5033 / YUAN-3) TaxID=663278 RepID=E6U5C3_ETHHY|nr:hypothetical protein [Ethanoligenens harbinense]ADU27936.1 hypothetical protein Ethha_2441 [Ethanoligenens harbinense YUAN-3]AVQ96965.1 hypothetical protein CXQ68_12545 [Ethanoligenens harbinense YUAN-3]AYF39625.1 hypothetical protein CXP51_12440 [Ethanoligenens harbinense]AYF42453.1 hypothetical protein CN246_12995 [Ethanoligenens harbinense]QCN93206.1 hypothetical protein DRA42_12590 [Ethanoligenens harbinense]
METLLTKRIKSLTHGYRPKMPSAMRTIRWADEVWTPSGIVDSIRFEDYPREEQYLCKLIDTACYSDRDNHTTAIMHPRLVFGQCFRDGNKEKSEEKCRGCAMREHLWNVGMMVTCFEVKITYADFKSKNGHNFHGNENYYCVPKALAPKIAPEILDDIGILTYYEGEKGFGLRKFKNPNWRDIAAETKTLLLYNAMKKWCDGATFIE